MHKPSPSLAAQFASPEIENELSSLLEIADEQGLDGTWDQAFELTAQFVQRPSKRLRPALTLIGYSLAQPGIQPPASVLRFAAAMEVLHAFMLVHDDVADRSTVRRGGPTLHVMLGDDQLATVVGDHLFARAVEGMLCSGAPASGAATRYMLGICRHTAVGQYLDLALSRRPLSDVTLWQTLRVAGLKTARYGFVAPLVCGAMLGAAFQPTLEILRRAGRHAGIAFQLKDDLLGLFGEQDVTGKPGDADFAEGKRTFPLIAAYLRANDADKSRLDALWSASRKSDVDLREARTLIERNGGRIATERVIQRSTTNALRALTALPPGRSRSALESTLHKLATRAT
jgi:geranylgeranyl diphosphate synthase type I